MHIDQKILDAIKDLRLPKIIAVSGFGGAGKSSIAKKLGDALGAPVIGVDSFQKKGVFDAEFSHWDIMDFARLEEEVLKPFHQGKDIRYGHSDAAEGTIAHTVEVKNGGVLIVEGVGIFRPELMKYFSYKIWVDVPMDEAIMRGKKRDREEYNNPTDELWDGMWKKNDIEYHSKFKPNEVADYIIHNK